MMDTIDARPAEAERGGPLAQARWEIDLLTQAFGTALMQMEVYEKEKDRRTIEQITQRFVPSDGGGVISRWNLPVILSFGKVLPALLTGATIVLRPSPLLPLTILRISDYIRWTRQRMTRRRLPALIRNRQLSLAELR